uniref:KASH domain-containing protein n=1 Tax=Hippocampus comes TaxID=109280 RepID=A0A3Q2Y288_HIPCM
MPPAFDNEIRYKSCCNVCVLAAVGQQHRLLGFFFDCSPYNYQTMSPLQPAESGEQKMALSSCEMALQQNLYTAASAASAWLDAAENEMLSGPVLLSEDTETQLTHLECTSKHLKDMSREVNQCRDLMGGVAGRLCGGEERALMEDTLEGLQERMGLLDSTLEQQCDTMRDRLQEHLNFQNELRMLFTALSESKHLLLQKIAATVDRPAAKQIEVGCQHVEDSLKEFEQRVTELKTKAEGLQSDRLSHQELLKLQDAYEELLLMVGSRGSGLNRALSLKAQYEAALRDLTDLVDTAQDKIAADQKMTVASVTEVQMLLDKHKEFFQSLECHMILTQTFYRKVSGLVAPRESQALEETMSLAQSVLKQAHRRGVELEGILESWSRLVEDYQALCRQLEAIECSIPTAGLVEETEERLFERIGLYQRLKASLTEHQPQLYQVLEEGKRLLLSVIFQGGGCQVVIAFLRPEHGQPAAETEAGGHGYSEDSPGPRRHSVGRAAHSHSRRPREAPSGP